MRKLLSLERVIPRLKARDKRDALRKLAAQAAGEAAGSADAITRSVMAGVEMPAFGPGTGVSLPHAFVPGLPAPIVTFARLDPALDFGAADGSETDLVALLLSPAERPGDHLRALACVARTLRDRSLREMLRAAESRDALYVILCGSDEQQAWRAAPAAPARAATTSPVDIRAAVPSLETCSASRHSAAACIVRAI